MVSILSLFFRCHKCPRHLVKLREAYASAMTQCPQKGSAGAESQDPWRLEKQKKCIDKTFNLGTFLVHLNIMSGPWAKLGPQKEPQFFYRDFHCVYCGFSSGIISEKAPNWWFWKWPSHVGDNSINIFCKYWCEIWSHFKTRPILFPIVQEYLRMKVR